VSGEGGLRARLRAHPFAADALLGTLLVGGESVLWLVGPREFWPRLPWPLIVALTLPQVAPIALRRRHRRVAVAVICLYSLLPLTGVPGAILLAAPLVVVTYTVGGAADLLEAAVSAVAMWLPTAAVGVLSANAGHGAIHVAPVYVVLVNLLFALVCFLFGRTMRNRRAYITALEERSSAAEQRHAALTAQAVADERRRIARELHDVVAHHVSVMGVLASGSRRILRRDPDAAEEALKRIEETGRSALREMGRLLAVLRTEAEPGGELAPPPGIGHLSALVEQVREAGLPVTLEVQGGPERIDEGVALTVYRVVQEALTNTIKHAGPATAAVRLEVDPRWLTVEVCDTGTGPRAEQPSVGHGLLGMRERISLYGGSLRTGPRPGGGFRVCARIPVEVADGRTGAAGPGTAGG
jgi:signal transduction histidine kinase